MLNIGEFARLGQVSPRMLRHYDEIGLLRPKEVDPHSGYRSYEVAQLGRLHRLLALRDLGFSLEQIHDLLDDDPSVEAPRHAAAPSSADRAGPDCRSRPSPPCRSAPPCTRRE